MSRWKTYSRWSVVRIILSGLLLTFLGSCKSDVKDQNHIIQANVLSVETLKIENKTSVRETFAESSNIRSKHYTISACLSENNLGQKLDRRIVESEGAPLTRNMTDNSGCVFWELDLDFDYTGVGRCTVLSQVINIPSAKVGTTINYAVDTITDEITDLSRGRGCTVLSSNNVSAEQKSNESAVFMDKVNMTFVSNEDLVRSDLKYIRYTTSADSCLRARASNLPVANTQIRITVTDYSDLHGPIVYEDQTNDQGCFRGQFISRYEQFKWSHWLKKDFKVEILSGPLEGQSIGRLMYVNPYEPSRQLFSFDGQEDDVPSENPRKEYRSIHIDGVMYIQIGNDQNEFGVNDYLGLTVSKSYQVVLTPRLDLGHRFTQGQEQYKKMPDGKFRLKFMLLAPNNADIDINEENFRNFTYITGAEKEVTLKDGVINSRMNINVRLADLERLATRAVTVFKLEPLEDTGLQETLVTGFFKAKIAWIKTNVFQSDILRANQQDLEDNYLSHLDDQGREQYKNLKDREDREYVESRSPTLGNMLTYNSETENDAKKLAYKVFIENLFTRIKSFEEEVTYGNPKIFEEDGDTPKDIFKRHLDYSYPGIQYVSTQEEEESESQTNGSLSLPSGLINYLYDGMKKESIERDDNALKAFTSTLCRQAFPDSGQVDTIRERVFGAKESEEFLKCLDKPQKYFELKPIMHSHKVDHVAPSHSNGLAMSISSRFSTYSSESENEFFTKRWASDVTLKLPLGDFFGSGVRIFDVSYTWSQSQSNGMSESDDLGVSKQISVESFTIEVGGTFEKCLLAKGKEYVPVEILKNMARVSSAGGQIQIPRQLQQYSEKVEKDFYICDTPGPHKYEEKWYFMQEFVPATTMLKDSFAPTEIKLIKTFRGESTFKEIKRVFEDETKMYYVTRTNNTETPDEKLYSEWGHLLKDVEDPATANKLLIRNFKSAFPGTVQ